MVAINPIIEVKMIAIYEYCGGYVESNVLFAISPAAVQGNKSLCSEFAVMILINVITIVNIIVGT